MAATSSIITELRRKWGRQTDEEIQADPEKQVLFAQARKAIGRRYGRRGRRRAKEILKMPHLVFPIPQEFDVRVVKGVVLFGEEFRKETARYEPGGIDKGDYPNRFKRIIRINDKSDPSRGIMIFINAFNPKYPSDSNEPSISYVGMEFFNTPMMGSRPSHLWPGHMPVVLARGRRTRINKKDSNRPIIAESIMIGVIPPNMNMKSEQTNVIFPSPRIDEQFLYVTALQPERFNF